MKSIWKSIWRQAWIGLVQCMAVALVSDDDVLPLLKTKHRCKAFLVNDHRVAFGLAGFHNSGAHGSAMLLPRSKKLILVCQ